MKTRATLACLLSVTMGWAQAPDSLRFDAAGRVTAAPAWLAPPLGSAPAPCSPAAPAPGLGLPPPAMPPARSGPSYVSALALRQWGAEQRRALRLALQRSFRAASDTLQAPTPLGRYYQQLWPAQSGYSAVALAADLRSMSDRLAKEPYQPDVRLPRASPLRSLDSLLAQRLHTAHACFAFDTAQTQYAATVKLLKLDLANELLVDYYDLTYRQKTNQPVSQLSAARRRFLVQQGDSQRLALGRLLTAFRHGAGVSLPLLAQAYGRHQQVARASLLTVLRAPWLKAWVWRYQALPNLNPLPFVDDAQVTLRAADSLYGVKAAHFTRYLGATLAQKPAAPKDFTVSSYADDVRFIGRERELFTDTAAYRQAVAANRAAALKLHTTRTTLNEVSIPKQPPSKRRPVPDYYLTLFGSQKNALAATTRLDALPVEARVVVTVHNLAPGHSLRLVRTHSAEIKDQSATQQAIAEGLDGASLLKTALGGLPASFLAFLAPKSLPGASKVRLLAPVRYDTSALDFDRPPSPSELVSIAKRLSYREATGEADAPDFWAEAQARTQQYVEQELASNPVYSFTTLLDTAARKFSLVVFEAVKPALTTEVQTFLRHHAATNSPTANALGQYDQLLQKVIAAYLARYFRQVAGPGMVEALRQDSLLLANSLRVLRQSSLPPHPAEAVTDPVARYHSEHGVTSRSDSTLAYTYGLQDVAGTKATQFATFDYRTGKRHFLQFSAGLAYTLQPVRSSELSITNGQVSYQRTDTRYRVYGGIHLYPWRLFLQDNRFGGKFKHRVNLLVAVGIPNPLDNLYCGLGYDLGPGIKLSGGLHLHGYTRYEVLNNQLVGEAKVYEPIFPFFSLGIDPASFVKAITLFF